MQLIEDRSQEKIDQEHWAKGQAAPWRCTICYGRDNVFVVPYIIASKPKKHPTKFGFLRVIIWKCRRCDSKGYGGLEVDVGRGWEETDDIREWLDNRGSLEDPEFVPRGTPLHPVQAKRSFLDKLKETLTRLKEW
jgi:hypothetical protein